MVVKISAEGREEWRQNWKLAITSLVGVSITSIAIPSLGAFMAPLEQEFGWNRAQISVGLTIFSIAGVFLAPILGGAVDRWGPRRFAMFGVLASGAAFALFGTVTVPIAHWLALWVVFSVVSQVPRIMVWSVAVSSEFVASRGVALGVISSGAGLGSLVAPILAGHLIGTMGWREAYFAMGIGWGSLAFVLSYFFFHSRMDRLRSSSTDGKKADSALVGVSAREGFRSMTFLKMALAALTSYTLNMALWVHLIPLLSSEGVSRDNAILIAGLIGVAAVIGQLSSGALADRVPGNVLSAVFACFPALALAIFQFHSVSLAVLVIPVILVGLSGGGANQMLSYLSTRFFGLRAFGKLYGAIASLIAVGAGVGPVMGGFVYDRTQSYDLLLIIGIPMSLVTAALFLSLGRYPDVAALGGRDATDRIASRTLR